MAKLNASSNMFTITIDYYYVLQRVKSRLLGLIRCFVVGQSAFLRLYVGQLALALVVVARARNALFSSARVGEIIINKC